MKLLYLSCHAILEYDELKIFEELGIDYFSLGSYVTPWAPVDSIRPPLSHKPDTWLVANAPDRNHMPKEFIDKFDVIVIMHVTDWIVNNWHLFKGKRVIWRTIGQSTKQTEETLFNHRMQGLEIVRYSFREINIPGNIGCNKVIRFYKDENEFGNWIGAGNEVITFAQNMKHRAEYCNYDFFEKIVQGFNAKVYGPHNELSGDLNGGYLTYEGMRQKMRDARVYVYTGTQPACYTLNFIEALMTGIPIVAIGPQHGNSLNIAGDMYEIPDIINNGVNGYWSDDLNVLRNNIQMLLNDKRLAERIGRMGRDTAIKMFGKKVIKEAWREYLKI